MNGLIIYSLQRFKFTSCAQNRKKIDRAMTAKTPTISGTSTGPTKEVQALTSNRTKLDKPVDFSFMNLLLPRDMVNEVPRGEKEHKGDEKYKSKCLRLNNNHITELTDMWAIVDQIIAQPNSISWIDLSFNELTKINPVLCDFPNLQILYLHGNLIADINEVDKLRTVKSLKKLALHGNPIENIKNYKWYVLALMPQLVNFDMSTVTKADRSTAETLQRNAAGTEKRRKKVDDDS